MSGQRLAIYTTVCHKVFIKKPANGTEEDDDKPILSEDEKAMLSQTVPDENAINQNALTVVTPAPAPEKKADLITVGDKSN